MNTILITGASSGIGAATARRFAKDRSHLILLARRYEKLAALKEELDCPVTIYELDVRDRDSVQKTIHQILQQTPIDVLVNNAGLALGLEPANKADLNDWEDMIDCNIKGLAYCTHAVLPSMVERSKGHIINIGSIAGTYPYPGANVYGASKAFVHQFSLNLRADLQGTGVRVTCIEAGLVGQTEFSSVRFKGDSQRAKNIYDNKCPLTPEDIAKAIHWCTEQPPHVNINVVELMPVTQAFGPLPVTNA